MPKRWRIRSEGVPIAVGRHCQGKMRGQPGQGLFDVGHQPPLLFQQLHIHGRAQLAEFPGRDRQAVFGDDVLRSGTGGDPVVFVFLPADRDPIGLQDLAIGPVVQALGVNQHPVKIEDHPGLVPYPLLCRDLIL